MPSSSPAMMRASTCFFLPEAITNGMPEWLIVPGLCLVVLVFGFYLFGYALDEILNPRLRRR